MQNILSYLYYRFATNFLNKLFTRHIPVCISVICRLRWIPKDRKLSIHKILFNSRKNYELKLFDIILRISLPIRHFCLILYILKIVRCMINAELRRPGSCRALIMNFQDFLYNLFLREWVFKIGEYKPCSRNDNSRGDEVTVTWFYRLLRQYNIIATSTTVISVSEIYNASEIHYKHEYTKYLETYMSMYSKKIISSTLYRLLLKRGSARKSLRSLNLAKSIYRSAELLRGVGRSLASQREDKAREGYILRVAEYRKGRLAHLANRRFIPPGCWKILPFFPLCSVALEWQDKTREQLKRCWILNWAYTHRSFYPTSVTSHTEYLHAPVYKEK